MPEYFPTPMQAVIFRNWEMVSKERIAKVLKTDVNNVLQEAKRMGLGKQGDTKLWSEKGYITIIRANWHLLPYNQLLTILDWSEEKLAYVLKEEDFLEVKMGRGKPECEDVVYRPLTEEEIEKTKNIKKITEKFSAYNEIKPFDFWNKKEERIQHLPPKEGRIVLNNEWQIDNRTNDETVSIMVKRFSSNMKKMWKVDLSSSGNKKIVLSLDKTKEEEYHKIIIEKDRLNICAGDSAGILRALYRIEDLSRSVGGPYFKEGEIERVPRFESRYIYSFCSLYEGALDVDSSAYCPDSLLEEYAKVGVNGIWLQAVLYRVTEFKFAPQLSEGWKKRQENLRVFINRAKSYGIKIYLYLNEPRTMPLSFFDKYPDMKGAVSGEFGCMCLSSQETQRYISEGVEALCKAVAEIGGFFTITMSENLTHCKSRKVDIACPHCENIKSWELASLVINLIDKGIRNAGSKAKLFAWDWGWSPSLGYENDDVKKCIESLPENVAILCEREKDIPFVRSGIEGKVDEYSLSIEGLSPKSLKNWEYAKQFGHDIAVKLQINNSWECSTVPYLPVFNTLIKMMESLITLDAKHLMLSWTLGGYPSPNIKLVSEAFFVENGNKKVDYDACLKMMFQQNSDVIKKATEFFCEAFSNFPFCFEVLYFGPHNGGVANPLYHKPTNHQATMTCFAYDDINRWKGIYSEEVLEEQFRLMSNGWKEGMGLIDSMQGDFKDVCYVAYTLFLSGYNQIRYVRLRNRYLQKEEKVVKDEILNIIESENKMAQEVYNIMCRQPSIGYEAANHYYFSRQSLLEKMVNCNWLKEYYNSQKECLK